MLNPSTKSNLGELKVPGGGFKTVVAVVLNYVVTILAAVTIQDILNEQEAVDGTSLAPLTRHRRVHSSLSLSSGPWAIKLPCCFLARPG